MNYCPHCHQASEGVFCPKCGQRLTQQEDNTSLPPGTVLSGTLYTYRLEQVLGQGGFGITYSAVNQERGERVAVKEYFPVRCALRTPEHTVIPKPGYEEEMKSGLDSFSGEARMLASLGNFPSVVRVMDHFQGMGTAFLVMEYLEGKPLHQKAAEMGGRIPARELLPKLPPFLRDLAAIHQLGVLHRDITPDNIMWMPDGTLKLLDFGSARSLEGNRSMTVLLKQGFAPVEQYLTSGQGSYTDVYALCATLYYVLTGVMPPSAMNRLENDELQPLASFGVDLTEDQEKAIYHGMTVQPKQRTQTVEELAQELGLVAQPQPESEPRFPDQTAQIPSQPRQQSQKRSHPRMKWGIIGVAGGLVVVLVVLAAVLLGGRDSKPTASRYTSPPSRTKAPATSTSAPEVKVDEEGYEYMVTDDAVTLVGFSGEVPSTGFMSMPDKVEGKEITAIGEEAFAGLDGVEDVALPIYLDTLETGAFRDCKDLREVTVYSDLTQVGEDCFDGCTALQAALVRDEDDLDGLLPTGCVQYLLDMDTGAGSLILLEVTDDGAVYGGTDQDTYVLLDVPSHVKKLTVPDTLGSWPVSYIHQDALDDASNLKEMDLGDNIAFPLELLEEFLNVESVWVSDGSFTQSWVYSCLAAWTIDGERGSGEPDCGPVREVVEAAMVRAEELAESYEHTRPNGDTWGSALDEADVSWDYGREVIKSVDKNSDHSAIMTELTEISKDFVEPSENHKGKYYTDLGCGVYYGDMIYLVFLGVIP